MQIDEGVHVHTLSFNEDAAATGDVQHMVLTHGYAAGTGRFVRELRRRKMGGGGGGGG